MNCCSNPSHVYINGTFRCANCGLDKPSSSQEYLPNWARSNYNDSTKICECGSDKTYGPKNTHHAYWCPKYKKD